MNNGNSRLFDVTDTAVAVIVDSACASVSVRQTPATAAWHSGPASSCVNAQSAGDTVTFTGPYEPGEIAGYVKLDAAGSVQFLRTETTSVATQTLSLPTGFSVPTGKTATITDADALTVGGKKIAQTWKVRSELLAASVDKWVYIAERACKVVSVKEVHSVAGGSGATVRPRKITGVAAPGAAVASGITEITSAAFDLTATANTIVTGALSATASDYTLAAGDKIGLDFNGTLTGLVGLIEIELQAV